MQRAKTSNQYLMNRLTCEYLKLQRTMISRYFLFLSALPILLKLNNSSYVSQ